MLTCSFFFFFFSKWVLKTVSLSYYSISKFDFSSWGEQSPIFLITLYPNSLSLLHHMISTFVFVQIQKCFLLSFSTLYLSHKKFLHRIIKAVHQLLVRTVMLLWMRELISTSFLNLSMTLQLLSWWIFSCESSLGIITID